MNFRQNSFEQTEIVIGIIGPVGCDRKSVITTIGQLAGHYKYESETIRLSELIERHCLVPEAGKDQYVRVTNLMRAGNAIRKEAKDNSIIAKLAAAEISEKRKKRTKRNVIYIVDSIKRPEEVEELKNIYGGGFYLFAVHTSTDGRQKYLANQCMIFDIEKQRQLIDKDKDEKVGHGQSTSEAFHLADFFLPENGDGNRMWNMAQRFLDIIFGDPFRTPTFNEYAMFMAYACSARSADMSRQVGAVIAKKKEIVSSGANECPMPGGGTYWPSFDPITGMISDTPHGRDYMHGKDRNAVETAKIRDELKIGIPECTLPVLEENIVNSGLNDITEYGRVVHAEMDAILGCARRGVSCDKADLFCTTFPCHNCAKHIVASGIAKVYYIEPYPKSKAFDMHPDAICTPEEKEKGTKVEFLPFVGVGPRQFLNLFSLNLSIGQRLFRKQKGTAEKTDWARDTALPRVKSFPVSYESNEKQVAIEAKTVLSSLGKLEIAPENVVTELGK